MTTAYYFLPTEQVMSAYQVSAMIGSAVLDWSTDRQIEIGLYIAYYTPVPSYGIYTQKVDGSIWVIQEPGITPDGSIADYPYYAQEWIITLLDEVELIAVEPQAQEVVAQEIQDRLIDVTSWLSARHSISTSWPVPQSLKDYINDLWALNTENFNYPWTLADQVQLQTFTDWPTRMTAYEFQAIVDPT